MTFKIGGMTFICNNREEYDKELVSVPSSPSLPIITISNLPLNMTLREWEAMFTFAPGFKNATLSGVDGTGSVFFTNRQDAINAAAFLNGYKYQGHVLQVKDDLSIPILPSSISFEDNYTRFRRMSCNDGLLMKRTSITPPCSIINNGNVNGNGSHVAITSSITSASSTITSTTMTATGNGGGSSSMFGPDLLEQTRKQFDFINNQEDNQMRDGTGNLVNGNIFKKEKYENAPCNTIYVGNLPFSATESELLMLFHNMPGFKRLCFRHKINTNINIGNGNGNGSGNGSNNVSTSNAVGNVLGSLLPVSVGGASSSTANINGNNVTGSSYDGNAVKNGPMCFVEFVDVNYATKAMKILDGTMLQCSIPEKGGIRLSYSKNPLGVRSNNNSIVNGILNPSTIGGSQTQQPSGGGGYPWTGCLAL